MLFFVFSLFSKIELCAERLTTVIIQYHYAVKYDAYLIEKAFEHWISIERLSWMMQVSLAERKGIISVKFNIIGPLN